MMRIKIILTLVTVVMFVVLPLGIFCNFSSEISKINESHQQTSRSEDNSDYLNSPWPMFRRDLQHTGKSPYDTSDNPGELKWKFKTEDLVYSSPTIGGDGTVYIGSHDWHLYALNPNGELKWKFKAEGNVSSSPAIGNDGTIYFCSYDKYLYALNPNGTLKWKYKTLDDIRSSPIIGFDGTIYVNPYGL